MRPSRLFLRLLIAWLCWAIVLVALRFTELELPLLYQGWWLAGVALLVVALIDALRPGRLSRLELRRQVPGSLALGVGNHASLFIRNPLDRLLEMTLAEPPNTALDISGLPVSFELPTEAEREIRYRLTPVQRGETTLAPLVARVKSRWGLWQHRVSLGEPVRLKVYPNFAPIAYIADMGMEQHMRQLGIHLAQRRGDGLEFKQLREFIEGDALRQVDWKATARYQKPISREYQEERDQDVFFLLDCGRRLRHMDDDLSHFDHALNAVLLTAYIAIRQGDGVGFSSFAGSPRWLSPVKGMVGTNILLNQLYDLESTSQNSDFLQVAEEFSSRHHKRSLVIIISNVREEDSDDLIQATRMLSQRHVVMVASLREGFLDEQLLIPVRSFNDALNYTATHQFMAGRRQLLRKLTAAGVVIVDAKPQELHIQLANEYLRMKRSHRL